MTAVRTGLSTAILLACALVAGCGDRGDSRRACCGVLTRNQARGVQAISRELGLSEVLWSVTAKDYRMLFIGTFLVAIANGTVLRAPLRAGDPILPVHAVAQVQTAFSSHLSAGRRAITMPVDAINSVSGLLQPGDLIIVAARPSVGKSAFVANVAKASRKDARDAVRARMEAVQGRAARAARPAGSSNKDDARACIFGVKLS